MMASNLSVTVQLPYQMLSPGNVDVDCDRVETQGGRFCVLKLCTADADSVNSSATLDASTQSMTAPSFKSAYWQMGAILYRECCSWFTLIPAI
mmetsp:Transcript_21919/g.89133  ORF Transcript_21919/g.89133 Transcript_21919/m.89133 type:complete len:93 (-) Transcript_21919:1193-1471(-)